MCRAYTHFARSHVPKADAASSRLCLAFSQTAFMFRIRRSKQPELFPDLEHTLHDDFTSELQVNSRISCRLSGCLLLGDDSREPLGTSIIRPCQWRGDVGDCRGCDRPCVRPSLVA